MNKLLKIMCGAALLAAAGLAPWQAALAGIRIESGSLAFLEQQGRINLEYDYSGLKVGRNLRDLMPEEEFIDREVARLNGRKAGEGDAWKREWIGQRTVRLEPRFQELLNKQLAEGKVPLEFGRFKEAKYTLILRTKAIVPGTPGFGPVSRINAEAVFVETNHRANVMAVVEMEDMPGRGAWSGSELREAYAKAGKELAILIHKKTR